MYLNMLKLGVGVSLLVKSDSGLFTIQSSNIAGSISSLQPIYTNVMIKIHSDKILFIFLSAHYCL